MFYHTSVIFLRFRQNGFVITQNTFSFFSLKLSSSNSTLFCGQEETGSWKCHFSFFFFFNLVINYWDKLRKSVFKEEKGIFETGINCVVNTVVSSYNLLNRDQNLNSTYNRIHCQKGRRGELMKLRCTMLKKHHSILTTNLETNEWWRVRKNYTIWTWIENRSL